MPLDRQFETGGESGPQFRQPVEIHANLGEVETILLVVDSAGPPAGDISPLGVEIGDALVDVRDVGVGLGELVNGPFQVGVGGGQPHPSGGRAVDQFELFESSRGWRG